MFWLMISLLGAICAVIAIVAFAVWIGLVTVQGLLTCIDRSLTNLNQGHLFTGLLYVIPAWLFCCAIAQFVSLAISFYQAVIK
jgi:hypothetical protein